MTLKQKEQRKRCKTSRDLDDKRYAVRKTIKQQEGKVARSNERENSRSRFALEEALLMFDSIVDH